MTGVLEAVRISCAGFPSKRPFADFVDHFWPLEPQLLRDTSLDDREVARRIVTKAGIADYQLGTTKASSRARNQAASHCHQLRY
jgi:myosin-5